MGNCPCARPLTEIWDSEPSKAKKGCGASAVSVARGGARLFLGLGSMDLCFHWAFSAGDAAVSGPHVVPFPAAGRPEQTGRRAYGLAGQESEKKRGEKRKAKSWKETARLATTGVSFFLFERYHTHRGNLVWHPALQDGVLFHDAVAGHDTNIFLLPLVHVAGAGAAPTVVLPLGA